MRSPVRAAREPSRGALAGAVDTLYPECAPQVNEALFWKPYRLSGQLFHRGMNLMWREYVHAPWVCGKPFGILRWSVSPARQDIAGVQYGLCYLRRSSLHGRAFEQIENRSRALAETLATNFRGLCAALAQGPECLIRFIRLLRGLQRRPTRVLKIWSLPAMPRNFRIGLCDVKTTRKVQFTVFIAPRICGVYRSVESAMTHTKV